MLNCKCFVLGAPLATPIWEAKLQGDRSLSRCTHALLPAGSEDRGKGKVEERQATRVTFALAGEVCFGEWVQFLCFALLWVWELCNVDDVIVIVYLWGIVTSS